MESLSRSNIKGGQPHVSVPLKQRRSGYEPSDTETEWQESPWHDHNNRNNETSDLVEPDNIKSNLPRNLSPLKLSRRQIPKVDYDKGSPPRTSPLLRRHGSSKSPYKTRRDGGRNVSPLPKPEHRRHVSPYKQGRVEHTLNDGMGNGEIAGLNMKQSYRSPTRDEIKMIGQLIEGGRGSAKSNYRRSVTTPPRQRGERTPSPTGRNMLRKQRDASLGKQQSVGEINEIVANIYNDAILESTDSISPGDIFFSRDAAALAMQKKGLPNNGSFVNHVVPKPPLFPRKDPTSHQRIMANRNVDPKARSNTGLSRTTMTPSSATSRQSSLNSKLRDTSGSSLNSEKFAANRRKSQNETWFGCVMRRGSCRTSKKSPERETRSFDEASFIGKAFVVEKLRQFWADKYQPASLNGFNCHKQEAQLLKQLVRPSPKSLSYDASYSIYENIMFYCKLLGIP